MTTPQAHRILELLLIEDVNGGIRDNPEDNPPSPYYHPREGRNGSRRFAGFLREDEREALWYALQELRTPERAT